jgi:hypothetical protein
MWQDRAAEGFALSPSIRLIETPGHTPQDITTMVATGEGAVAFTISGGRRKGLRRIRWRRIRQRFIAIGRGCSSSPR